MSANILGGDNGFHVGVSTQDRSQPTMTDVTASASGSSSRNPNTAVQIDNGSVTVSQSTLSATGPGQGEALANDGGSAKVALSQLVGGTEGTLNSLQCFDNYDENLNTVNCRSPSSK